MFIYRRGQDVRLTIEARRLYNMYRLARFYGIKPWDYNMDYDDKGRPIVYKDDIDALLFIEALDKDGKNHKDWLSSKGAG